jgi:serine/threonine protein kinase
VVELPESKFILKLHGGSHVSKPQFYVCENAPNGNIAEFLGDKAHSVLFWRLFKQVTEGIKFLHENKAIHGGLKCNNILVGADYTPKLADFGFSSVRSLSAGMSPSADMASKTSVRWNPNEVVKESGGGAPTSPISTRSQCA